MLDQKVINRYSDALRAGDVGDVAKLTDAHPELLNSRIASGTPLHVGAYEGQVNVMQYLFERGIDINAPSYDCPDRPIHRACSERRIDAVRWLLDHGANVNAGQNEDWPTPIIMPVIKNDESLVRLLLERGANVNATYGSPPKNALGFAIEYGHKNIEALLRAHGAVEPPRPAELDVADTADAILKHVQQRIGAVNNLSQIEIVPAGLPITIHSVPPAKDRPWLTLFTTGMSELAMHVPVEHDAPRYAELLMYLPPDWPTDDAAIADPRYRWPYLWLRNLAREIHGSESYIPDWMIISTDDPPKPVSAETRLCCFLLMQSDQLEPLELADGKVVHFFDVTLLYEGERDFAISEGIEKLLERFSDRGVDIIVGLDRADVSTL